MQVLPTPWRMDYITRTREVSECIFCSLVAEVADDAPRFILHRARRAFLVMNIYPYTPGHLLVVPYAHAPNLVSLDASTHDEMLALCQLGERLLRRSYGCRSIHVGANLGRAAGAGVPEHLHYHIVAWPEGALWERCCLAEDLPEGLPATYARLRACLLELLARP
jgi:ATP adenylyltransferase